MDNEIKDRLRAAFKEPYPRNLFLTLAEDKWYDIQIDTNNVTSDMIEGLEYAISTLSPKDQKIIRMRYAEKMTFTAIGKEFDVTGERIRTVEHRALIRLRRPTLLGYIKYGKVGYEERCAKIEEEHKNKYDEEKYQIRIINMDMPVRAQNRLIAKGYDIVKDIVELTEEEILGIQYLGRKGIIDVANALEGIGVTDTVWSEFLIKKGNG